MAFRATQADLDKLSRSLAGPDWFAFQPAKEVVQGVIDMNQWLDLPAGKRGGVRMVKDGFVFENGTPIKFWGVNLSDTANAPDKDADKPCPRDHAQQFLAKATAAQSQTDDTDENLVVTTRSTDGIICFSAHDKANPMGMESATIGGFGAMGGMGGGMGGFGGSVHTSGFSK